MNESLSPYHLNPSPAEITRAVMILATLGTGLDLMRARALELERDKSWLESQVEALRQEQVRNNALANIHHDELARLRLRVQELERRP